MKVKDLFEGRSVHIRRRPTWGRCHVVRVESSGRVVTKCTVLIEDKNHKRHYINASWIQPLERQTVCEGI